MPDKDAREHDRCSRDATVSFSFLNQSVRYIGLARNFSRSGMYFESEKPVRIGSTIVIRPIGCQESEAAGDFGWVTIARSDVCGEPEAEAPPCREMKSMVMAEVKRCERIGAGMDVYGIGVCYVAHQF
ncbi:MAG: hypothetical protein ACOWWM_02370 [Desulfobacterales bacterium]